MKLTCSHRCFFMGRSIKSGTVVDVPENLLDSPIVKSSFSKPDARAMPEHVEKEAFDPASLTAAEYRRRLDEMGVAYSPRASKPDLIELYKTQTGLKP